MHLSIQPKENIICVSMKSLKSLHTMETINWKKDQSLLTSVNTRTNLPFYGMIARTKSYVFTVIFLAVFPLEPTFWPAQFMFCIYGFQNKSSSSKRRFHWRILRGIFPVKTTQKWRHLFVWILLHCNFFVIHYIFWLKIVVRHKTLSIKT